MLVRLSLIMLLLSFCLLGRAEVHDFSSWKVQKINTALDRLRKAELTVATSLSSREKMGLFLLNRARSLTPIDFWREYVSRHNPVVVLQQIAKRTSSEEMTELLLAYAQLQKRRSN